MGLGLRATWSALRYAGLYRRAGGMNPDTLAGSIEAAVRWLCAAQDIVGGGGFARAYSLPHGWELPYPETTGYIIPTFLALHAGFPGLGLEDRAWRAGHWLTEVQFESGAICSKQHRPGNTKPSVFNTGMVLHGWVSLIEHQQALSRPSGTLSRPPGEGLSEGFRDGAARLRAAARKAVNWLIEEHDSDGAWVKNAYNGIPHTYYTMVDWALLRYAALAHDDQASGAAFRHLEWTLRQQKANGWFDHCWFGAGDPVTTHTLSYTTQGLVESALLLGEGMAKSGEGRGTSEFWRSPAALAASPSDLSSSPLAGRLIEAAIRATEPLRRYFEEHGTIAGTFDENWRLTATWECCTGNAQTSLVWQALGKITGDTKWTEAARKLNLRLLQYQKVGCHVPGIDGAIPGSWPISGGYDRHAFPNHAAKFHIDALFEES